MRTMQRFAAGLTMLTVARRTATPIEQRTYYVWPLWVILTARIFHQPGPLRSLQDSIHEEESLKQIVDRTIRYTAH
jgi:hypothetical protein